MCMELSMMMKNARVLFAQLLCMAIGGDGLSGNPAVKHAMTAKSNAIEDAITQSLSMVDGNALAAVKRRKCAL